MARCQAMRSQLRLLTVLFQHAFQAPPHRRRENHLAEARLRICNRQQPGQLASGLYKRSWWRRPRHHVRAFLRLVDQSAQLICKLSVPLAGRLSSDLHRDRKEASIVTGRVALKEGLDLFGRRGRHMSLPQSAEYTDRPTSPRVLQRHVLGTAGRHSERRSEVSNSAPDVSQVTPSSLWRTAPARV